MKTTEERKVRAVNAAIERVSREVKRCREQCAAHGSPLRGISFRVLDDGCTKLHVTYRRYHR